jgi:YfiH family protein
VSPAPYTSLNLGRTVGDDPAHVEDNLRRFAGDVGYDPERLYEVVQVHAARVEHVEPGVSAVAFRTREADALVSGTSGAAVGIKVADCVAVLLADPVTGAVAAAHAGWRGVVASVLGATVQALGQHHGVPASRLCAAIFPCIGPSAFEVGEEVAAQLESAVGTAAIVRAGTPKPHVDLGLAVRVQLTGAGLLADHVETLAGCTFGDPSRFFSYRRDGGVTGRHLAAIVPRC